MQRKDYYLALALAMVAGFVGGCMSGRLVAPEPAVAQLAPPWVKIVQTESLRLVDQAGRLRAVFEVVPDGSVSLVLGNQNSVTRVWLGVDAAGNARLSLKDEKGQSSATLSANAVGSPTLLLSDQNSRGGALLGEGSLPISDAGIIEVRPAGSLLLMNKDGKVVWRAP